MYLWLSEKRHICWNCYVLVYTAAVTWVCTTVCDGVLLRGHIMDNVNNIPKNYSVVTIICFFFLCLFGPFSGHCLPCFPHPVTPTCGCCMPIFGADQFAGMLLHLSSCVFFGFLAGPLPLRLPPRIHFGILLLNILTTYPTYCNLLTSMYVTRSVSVHNLYSSSLYHIF